MTRWLSQQCESQSSDWSLVTGVSLREQQSIWLGDPPFHCRALLLPRAIGMGVKHKTTSGHWEGSSLQNSCAKPGSKWLQGRMECTRNFQFCGRCRAPALSLTGVMAPQTPIGSCRVKQTKFSSARQESKRGQNSQNPQFYRMCGRQLHTNRLGTELNPC